jgi:hypothetical protein
MKKNFQFVVVIFFVTLAFLVMLNDVMNHRNENQQNSVELYSSSDQLDQTTTDLKDED